MRAIRTSQLLSNMTDRYQLKIQEASSAYANVVILYADCLAGVWRS